MIVARTPRVAQIVREVWRPLALLFVWDVAVTVAWHRFAFRAPSLPLPLFGSALALFLGARGGSAYQRWWEGRTLWGATINASRAWARQLLAMLPMPEARDLRRTLVLRQLAFVNALRLQLRRQEPDAEVLRFLSPDEAAPLLARANRANAVLDGSAERIADALARGWIDTVQQARLEATLFALTDAQGGMERLKNTPLPSQYRFVPTVFTQLFCLLLPVGLVETLGVATPLGSTVAGLMFLAALRIGDDLVDPFAGTVHDVPMGALCRTIEIDLLQAIGDPAPPPAAADGGVLW